jgi:predicted dehydrogenase
MLDKEARNIDAVIVTVPDHMHGTAAMWAIERGKHVYVQKPLTRTVWEARQLQEAANKYKVATQMGNQATPPRAFASVQRSYGTANSAT